MPTTVRPASIDRQIRPTLSRALDALLSLQHEDGHFCGELEGDSILQSEYLLMKFILGQEHQPLVDGSPPEKLKKIAHYLRQQQHDDGGWGQFPGSGIDLSATTKGYFALKLMGDDSHAPHMQRAREVIRKEGGAERCNSFTNFYLACLGQISWNAVPAIPPEIMLLPRWSYFHLTKVSAWTRTMIVPLSIVTTLRPTRQLSREQSIDELFVDQHERHRLTSSNDVPAIWSGVFKSLDSSLKVAYRFGGTPLRQRALQQALQWCLARAGQDEPAPTEGLGAIFPPMVYLQIVLHAMGYQRKDKAVTQAERELDAFCIEEEETIRIQPCFSPVWDTGIALYALADCGMTVEDDAANKAAGWLIKKENRHLGDWAANIPKTARLSEPDGINQSKHRNAGRIPAPLNAPSFRGGWWFEYNNAWYPDVDDTAMVAMALRRIGGTANLDAAHRGVEWMLAMQNDDGGWAAFDRTRHRQILEYVPFADHNAMQDPSCPDITGRVLECLSWHGYTVHDHPVQQAVSYVLSRQEPEGCWFGRWGVNYIYGTWQAVIGPIRCGINPTDNWVQRAGKWIKSIQKPDGSFGESANSYEDSSLKGQGPSTASQTAWAAMVLQEVFGHEDHDLKRAIDWLADTQLQDKDANDKDKNPDRDPPGSWVETEYTGTGFPRVFYLRYHLYRLYFPLMAIGRYLGAQNSLPERMHHRNTENTEF